MSAYILLKKHGTRFPEAKYLFSRCCVDLNKFSESEECLTEVNCIAPDKTVDKEFLNYYGQLAAHVLELLGQLYMKTDRIQKAIEYLSAAAKLNPLLWSAFTLAASLGSTDEISSVYQGDGPVSQFSGALLETPALNTPINLPVPPGLSSSISCHYSNSSAASSTSTVINKAICGGRSIYHGTQLMTPFTPSFGLILDSPATEESIPSGTVPQSNLVTPAFPEVKAPIKALRKVAARTQSVTSDQLSSLEGRGRASSRSEVLTQNQVTTRRSTRLFQASIKENNSANPPKGRSTAIVRKGSRQKKSESSKVTESNELVGQRPLNLESTVSPFPSELICQSFDARVLPATSVPSITLNDRSLNLDYQRQSAAFCGDLKGHAVKQLREFAEIELAMAEYDCQRAVELLKGLSSAHANSPWALSMLGRAYFELSAYEKSVEQFRRCRQESCHYINGMEYYSTALWHLKRDVELSALSLDLTEDFKLQPETWCCVGNCFSLQKEHETAIKFLKRAVQINPDFAYAYNLLGHEYIELEEYEQAVQCFRAAIRVNPKHYNAWCGIGKIHHRQEKLQLAEFHYRKAMSINPRNSLIMCHISVIQQAQKQLEPALALLDQALAFSPRNPLCRYQRATALFAQEQNEEALQELEELKQIVPKEARVYFLAGKIHKKLGQTHLALMNFSWATDLDPKGGSGSNKNRGEHRYEEPVTALAAMELEDVGDIQTMESDESV